MKKEILLSFIFVVIFIAPLTTAFIAPGLEHIIDGLEDQEIDVIVTFRERRTPDHVDDLRRGGMSIGYEYNIIDGVSGSVPANAIENIVGKGFVESVEKDYEVELVLDDSVSEIDTDKVWDQNKTGKEVDVAIIDTGIYENHDFLDVAKSVDFTGEGEDDLHGHGTHVAGIVASTDEEYRGVAFGSNLFNVKVLNEDGSGSGSDVIKGIEWAVDNGADIISLSLGASVDNCDGTDAISRAVDSAVSEGVITVVSAGNYGPDEETITLPGCAKDAITIGSSDGEDVASFSSRGPTADGRVKPDLVAPGVSIISTWNDGDFRSSSGTSMSAPFVSGVVALLLETDSSLEYEVLLDILANGAKDLGLDENTQGEGKVNAYESYILVEEKEEYLVIFNETNSLEEVLIEVYDEDSQVGDELITDSEGEAEIILLEGDYYYLASKENYGDNEGVFEVKDNIIVNFEMVEKEDEDKDEEEKEDEERILPPGHERRDLERGRGRPGSFGYGVGRALERLRLTFTFNNEKKAERYVGYAERRLGEAIDIIEEDKERAEQLLEEYEENLEEGNSIAEKARRAGKDISKVEESVVEATLIHEEVLREVSERVPEEAREIIDRALNNSRGANERSLEKINEDRPDRAVEIHMEIAERRSGQIRERIERGEDISKEIEDYNRNMDRVSESIEEAKRRGIDDELLDSVERKIQERVKENEEVLREVSERVSEEAREAIDRAIDESERMGERVGESINDRARSRVEEEVDDIKDGLPENISEGPSPSAKENSENSDDIRENISDKVSDVAREGPGLTGKVALEVVGRRESIKDSFVSFYEKVFR